MEDFFNKEDFNPGGIPDPIDSRDYTWREVGGAPAPFDWDKGYDVEDELRITLKDTKFLLKANNQNGSFSCGGQAWGKYGSVKEAIATGSYEERSAKFVYAQTFVPGGGSAGRENCKVVTKQGWGLEALTASYENGNPPSEAFMERPQDITEQARMEAKKAMAMAYSFADGIEEYATAAQANHGLVMFIAGSNNGTWHSAVPQPPKAGEKLWYHWVYVGKAKHVLVNGVYVKAVAILNSWGSAVGENGWQWITEDYFNSGHVGTGWALSYKTQEIPQAFKHDFNIDMGYGETSGEVVALQKALTIDGEFDARVSPTGFYGDITRKAVLAFQIKHQVAPLGELQSLGGKKVGPATRAALNRLFGQ